MSKIELRLSNVDPPLPDPPRTIYRDIVNLPDPVKLGITIRYFNHDDVDLYFQITGSGTGYTFGTVNLGLLASGANAYKNLDEFASRAKPSPSDLTLGEMEENITLILKAYTDSGYTNLKWTYERIVTVHWINSADAAFTVDVLNNFDDGTVQGWSGEHINYYITPYGGIGTLVTADIAADYVLSAPYSLKITDRVQVNMQAAATFYCWIKAKMYKQFSTPNKTKIFAVADVRISMDPATRYGKLLELDKDSTVLIKLGKEPDTETTAYFPHDKWVRLVVPLPANTTLTLSLIAAIYGSKYLNVSPSYFYLYFWLDDFKIISK
jgi:hypothetical protein